MSSLGHFPTWLTHLIVLLSVLPLASWWQPWQFLCVLVLSLAIRRLASRCCPWWFAARRLGVPVGNSPLGFSVLPLAICSSASRCRPRYLSLVSHLGVSKVYQSVFGIPISVWCTNRRTLVQPYQNDPWRQNVPSNVPWCSTNQRLVYQSAYPGTALPKQP